ncbi:MAG TPA: hypothetical protein VMM77_10715 [Gemmatimonadaceae bacterium]|nr:hypothetical protein [Gemmatimonadaceae bacterium]
MCLRLEPLIRAAVCVTAVAVFTGCADSSDTSVGDSATASGASTADASGDLRALANYDLRMEQVDKYYAAFRNIGVAMQGMTPQQREALGMDASDQNLDAYISGLESQPAINSAIRDAGLTAREFALILWSMLQSGMASAVMDMQPNADKDSLAREMEVNMDNVNFVRQNEAELRRKQEALQADLERMGVTEDQ